MTTATLPLPTLMPQSKAATAAAFASQAELDERALVARAAAGDAAAYECLYRSHVGRIFGLCRRLSHGDTARAEQATQDAFVRAWEKLSSFRGESQFGTWLHRLTVNVVLGEHRLLRRWVSFEDGLDSSAEGFSEPAGGDDFHDENIGLRMDLERAIARLPKGARTVLVLHDIEGYAHEDISTLTGIAVGTSKAQLHRARRLMQGWLK